MSTTRTWSQVREMSRATARTFLTPQEFTAFLIMEELDDRKGLTRDLDDDIKDEIFEAFMKHIERNFPQGGAA